MVKRISVILAVLSLFVITNALTGCAHVDSAEQLLPFTTVAKGLFSGITDSQQLVVRTQETWQELWQRHTAALEPRPRLPTVDFSREMLIAVFRGKINGPFPVDIQQIIKRDNELLVRFVEVTPSPRAPLGVAVVSSPFHIVSLQRLPMEAVFERVPP